MLLPSGSLTGWFDVTQASLFLFRSALSQGSHVKWKRFSHCVPGELWHLRDGLLELWKSALLSQNFGTHYQMMNKDDKQFWWAGPELIMTKTEDRAENCNYFRNLHRNVNSSISFICAAYDLARSKTHVPGDRGLEFSAFSSSISFWSNLKLWWIYQ